MVDIVIISLHRSSRLMGCYRLLRQIAPGWPHTRSIQCRVRAHDVYLSSSLCCSSPLSRSPTICCSEYSATSRPLGLNSVRRSSTKRMLYRPTIRSVTSVPFLILWTSFTPNTTYVHGASLARTMDKLRDDDTLGKIEFGSRK